MNKLECDILNELRQRPYVNQRDLAGQLNCSAGSVNHALKNLIQSGHLNQSYQLTALAHSLFSLNAPKSAIILAAGYGMRMVPINTVGAKALLEVHGEPLIERQIRQLHEAGITEIYVVVGFMKEKFEYLIDTYNVKLIVNPDYATKNNMHSLKRVLNRLSNSYIVPCDIWCKNNPFHSHELYSWYMVSDALSEESTVRVNRKSELVSVPAKAAGNTMVGISYLLEAQAALVRNRILEYVSNSRYDDLFWEEALFEKERMIVYANTVNADDVAEINTYEQLRELDGHSRQLRSDAIEIIASALHVTTDQITGIEVLKKGMTNRSFLFSCAGKQYIMRIPGEGTDQLINRVQEAAVYHALDGSHICDEIVYIDPGKGWKITEFWQNARVCDPLNSQDVARCMNCLRQFHQLGLRVEHEFDIFRQIDFYESLWNGTPSAYRDYAKTKERVLSLRPYIEAHAKNKVLTHIDAVPDNFLFIHNENGDEEIRLIDWEYAGMQDPHVDIAMFCIYALYDREHVDQLIRSYFPEGCNHETQIKIYCYIAVCGLLWSNWCEFKRNLGVEFGEYSLQQYRYAKEYYKIAFAQIQKGGNKSAPG